MLFAVVVGMLILFSLFYRRYFRLFLKMIQTVRSLKERQPFFMPGSGNEGAFRNFMIFQTLLLSAVALFAAARWAGWIPFSLPPRQSLGVLAAIGCVLFAYYQIKQFVYFCLGAVFVDRPRYKLWKENYQAVNGLLGVAFYVPVVGLLYVNAFQKAAVCLFIILFILSRLVIIYKLIRIFYKKRDILLYLILYLCTQEILPLVFLYEGMVCLYNIIEKSTLWH